MKSKRLIVVSLDALSSIDFDMFSKLPNFKKFIRHGACCPTGSVSLSIFNLSGTYIDCDGTHTGTSWYCEQYSAAAGTVIAGLVLAAELYTGNDII